MSAGSNSAIRRGGERTAVASARLHSSTSGSSFVPASRKALVAAAESRIPAVAISRGVRSRLGDGSVRMASDDEGPFFADPDAPAVVDGLGPPGPLDGGDQV